MKSQMTKDFSMKSKLRRYADGGGITPNTDASAIPDSFIGQYREKAVDGYGQNITEALRQAMQQKAVESMARGGASTLEAFAPRMAPALTAAGGMLSKANALTGAATTGVAIGGMAYDHMSPETQGVIGGTMNQIAQRFGGGVNDDAMMLQAARSRLRGYADGGDIISQGNQRIEDAIEAQSRGEESPTLPQTIATPSRVPQANIFGVYPTDKTPLLDKIFQGAIKVGLRQGGPVKGPGGPTDDKVPAMLSHGEYVLPADTVKAVGKENLDVLRAKTHEFVGPRPGMANGGDGDVFQQFSQQLGDQPRYQASDPGSARLNSLFDQSAGFIPDSRARSNSFSAAGSAVAGNIASGANAALTGLDPEAQDAQSAGYALQQQAAARAQSSAGSSLKKYLDQTAGVQPLIPPPNGGRLQMFADGGMATEDLYCETPAGNAQGWLGSSKLRFMADGGEAGYPQGWSGDPRLRFMANGGSIYPGLDPNYSVNEIPEITMRGNSVVTSEPPVQYPGPEGIHVRAEGLPEPELPNYRTPNGFAPTEAPVNPTFRPGAASVADAAAPAAADAAGLGTKAAGVGEAAVGGLRGMLGTAASLPGRALSAGGRMLGAVAAPAMAGIGAYQALQGTDADRANNLAVPDATNAKEAIANKARSLFAGTVSGLTGGLISPADYNNITEVPNRMMRGQDEYNPPRDKMGFLTGALSDLTGATDRKQVIVNPTVEDVAGTGGLRSKASPQVPPAPTGQTSPGASSPGAPGAFSSAADAMNSVTPGTAVINGRIVSPEEIQRKAQASSFGGNDNTRYINSPDHAAAMQAHQEALAEREASNANDRVFHMPVGGGSSSSAIDELERKIGNMGNSPAKLRALTELATARAGNDERRYGTDVNAGVERERTNLSNTQIQRQLANDRFAHNLDFQKFGIEEGRLNRQLNSDIAVHGLAQAKFRDEQRKDLYTNLIPGLLPGLGVGQNEKGEADPKAVSDVNRRLQASEPAIMQQMGMPGQSLTDLPKSMLPGLARAALQGKNDDEAQQGISGFLASQVMGGSRKTTDNIASGAPDHIQKGAFGDMVFDASGRPSFVRTRLRNGHVLGPVDEQQERALNGLRSQ